MVIKESQNADISQLVKDIPFIRVCHPSLSERSPLVSVVIVTYKHESFIAQAIEGILNQEVDFPIELIIGEDCSPDNTRAILKDYQSKYPSLIKLILNSTNVGPLKNFVNCVLESRGKYLAICEGDDYWHHPRKLAMQVEILENRPEIGFVHGGVDIFYQETNKRTKWDHRKGKEMLDENNIDPLRDMWLKGYKWPFVLTICLRRELFLMAMNKVWNNDRILFTNSYLFYFECFSSDVLANTKVKFINESLGTYRVLPESLSHSNNIRLYSDRMKGLLKLDKYLGVKYGFGEEFINFRTINKYKAILYKAYEVGGKEYAADAWRELRAINAPLNLRDHFAYFVSQFYLLHRLLASIRRIKNIIYRLMNRVLKFHILYVSLTLTYYELSSYPFSISKEI